MEREGKNTMFSKEAFFYYVSKARGGREVEQMLNFWLAEVGGGGEGLAIAYVSIPLFQFN